VVGGQVVLALRPNALAELSRQHTTVLVTGTNGKTTTTAMLAGALTELGAVVSNSDGANMPDGLVATLSHCSGSAYGALEVDEAHLPAVLMATEPVMVVLLNLSRDQMDRAGEVSRTERALRQALSRCPWVTVIANCDDILVTSVAAATRRPVWVAAGAGWQADATACPRCGDVVHDRTGQWWCACGFSRPRPDWTLQQDGLRTPDGRRVPLAVGVPGLANRANAAMAAAAAATLGAPLVPALNRIGSIQDVAGRYRLVDHQGWRARLLLAKNPAGWRETLDVACEHERPVVLAVNARAADGKDTSWLWDVSFDSLAGRRVIVSGEYAMDLAVRLTYAEVRHTVVPDPVAAITAVPPGLVDVIGNYTAFQGIARRLVP
jgi:UDP-N-acetylmuramyl tripeptide synthase